MQVVKNSKKRMQASGFIPAEEQEHLVVADWLRLHGVLFHHSPNEGSRSKRVDKHGRVWSPEGNRLKRMGVKKGFPDFIILDHAPYKTKKPLPQTVHIHSISDLFEDMHESGVGEQRPYVGTAIELKRRREAYSRKAVRENRVATPEQKEWLELLAQRGWCAALCYGADEAITLLERLGYGKRRVAG